ncbi:zinc finger CCCH domain-containing protein 3 isoform X3 [Megalobrama amblycephala]|uniref:zinc finger CCCH domain-containing protein 3 isoform X3 n=1 Tax=Megalobrama amblycephala TaxID=75352 RepID=UPI0020143F5A|nr:zinc finger CCCH domain-containing protein 3 isoform X3 [Megalobrama amblycephala]
MAEREALKREIEELQNLINDYKSTHGDIPSSSAQWGHARHGSRRGQSRGHASHYTQSYSSLPQPNVPHSSGSWRKTYSLNNKTNRAIGNHVSHSAMDHLNQPPHHNTISGATATEDDVGLVGNNRVLFKKLTAEQTKGKSATYSLGVQSETSKERKSEASGKRTVLISATGKTDHGCTSTNEQTDSTSSSEPERRIKPTLKSSSAVNNPSIPSTVKHSVQLQVKPHLPTAALSNRTVVMPSGNKDSSIASSAPNLQSQASLSPTKLLQSQASLSPTKLLQSQASLSPTKLQLKLDSTQTRIALPCHKRSLFTWVKNQEMVNTKSTPKPVTSLSPASGSSPGTATVRRVSGTNKRVSRKPNLSLGAPKTSKYTWVSSSCSSSTAGKANTSTKMLHKPLSPKSLKAPVRTSQGGPEGPKKEKRYATTSTTSSKKSRAGGASTSLAGHASRYRWKAAGQNATANAFSSTSRTTHKGTVYRWTANKNGQKGEKGSALSLSSARINPTTTPLSAGAFKLRSRTKIIRKSVSNPSLGSPIVQTIRSQYSLRRRTHTPVKTPTHARRAQPKVLVSFGRHKLRRLSVTATSLGTSRSGPTSSSVRSPASHRVIKTRYKIDTRRAHTIHHNPALSYRVKRVHSARSNLPECCDTGARRKRGRDRESVRVWVCLGRILLQNRLRTTPERQWRGRSMRWIGGALYRVSANKLSRTQTTCTPNSRPGEWYNPYVSSTSNQGRTSATRYVANRAVQRSLAIIRQARQKKQKAKQYCMYYNRFGKCNHGDTCPYIHDPDKVAVCTRFLRGTCKQTDGTCPFSHKVAKEKMPVCSYFLKGICNNSSCPYSHVYVSRKADVCKDFVRGYCPQGDKCKKKHTLVCPDFSSTGVCPRGSKCKLHHRESVKRTGSNASFGPAKKARTRDIIKSSEEVHTQSTESIQADEGSSSSGPEKLPSFISLSSSPDMSENPDSPKIPPVAGLQAKGKTLHIKPRFLSSTQTEPLPKEG